MEGLGVAALVVMFPWIALVLLLFVLWACSL